MPIAQTGIQLNLDLMPTNTDDSACFALIDRPDEDADTLPTEAHNVLSADRHPVASIAACTNVAAVASRTVRHHFHDVTDLMALVFVPSWASAARHVLTIIPSDSS